MNFTTSSFSQAGFTQSFNQQANNTNNKQALVTTNSVIFPSLNPLAGLYRNQPSKTPTTTVRRPSTSQEPIKKIKTNNNGREAIVMPVNNQESVRMSKKEITNNNSRMSVVKTSDDELFRVPQLPKRLRNQKQNKEQNKEQNEYVQRIQEFQSIGGAPLDMSAFYQSPAHNQTQIPFVAQKQESMANNRCQAQDFSAGVSPALLNALYQRLSLEIYHFQLRQNMLNMAQLSQ